MKKSEFLNELRKQLSGLPKEDIEDRINFYSEAIDDRIDEGKTEEQAVEEVGPVDKIVSEIAQDTSLVKLVTEKVKPNRSLKVWEIVLLVLGFPVWFPLVLTALILCLVAYLLIWVFVFVAYSVEFGLVAGSIGGLISFFAYIFSGTFNVAPLGMFIMCVGGAILMVFACIGITKATLHLSKKIILKIKTAFIKKGSNE